MDLMTIGAFAERTRLSRKALRLYDRLGLLPPARTDPGSGYRFYSEDQVASARLVALLRRLGMPLAVIADITARPPAMRQTSAPPRSSHRTGLEIISDPPRLCNRYDYTTRLVTRLLHGVGRP